MNKKILLANVLALTISLAPISSVKAAGFGPPPPSGTNTNGRLPRIYSIRININSEDSVKVGEPIKFGSEINDRVEGYCRYDYSWDFGDGNTSDNYEVASNVFNEPGIYTVKLKIVAKEHPGCFPTESSSPRTYIGETTKTIKVE